jgi:hypothetical protein
MCFLRRIKELSKKVSHLLQLQTHCIILQSELSKLENPELTNYLIGGRIEGITKKSCDDVRDVAQCFLAFLLRKNVIIPHENESWMEKFVSLRKKLCACLHIGMEATNKGKGFFNEMNADLNYFINSITECLSKPL